MGGPRRRIINQKDSKDENGDTRSQTSEPEMFDFTLFGGISIKVPKWWTQQSNNEDTDSVDPDPLAPFQSIIFKVICVLTFLTRGYKIAEPAHVCWDETHFGKFANHYLNGTFFFDVHPPLGKMLLALAGHMTNYNGSFPFVQPGDPYGDTNYVGMRVFCATLGGLCIPLIYLTVKELTKSVLPAILSSAFVLFDTGCLTLSQYILLDPILMFFITLSIFCSVKFQSVRQTPYTNEWWFWNVATGFSIGCAFSVKWVGLFIILFVGITTVQDLWELAGDLNLSAKDLVRQFGARVFGLIVVPIIAYLFFFHLHFKYLPLSGPGDGFFSSAFQSTLKGNPLHELKVPGELAYGASITIKNQILNLIENKIQQMGISQSAVSLVLFKNRENCDLQEHGTLLHSHASRYPAEHPPEQQQITGYSHKDENNVWRIHYKDRIVDESSPLEFVRDGDLVRLMHVTTTCNLHAHMEKAPISNHLWQVSGYGGNGEGDLNDVWQIKAIHSTGPDGLINTVRTPFQLIHNTTGCALMDTGVNLPKWGFEQREMACNIHTTAYGTTWNIEGNTHRQVPDIEMKLMAPSFFSNVYESHVRMLRTNNAFKPKEGEFNSLPYHWPINFKGQVFSGADHRIYLLGNPVIWWGILATYLLFGAYYVIFELRNKRNYAIDPELKDKSWRVIGCCTWLLIGWSLHYLPFYLMGRVLYFHHYFPAYQISAMLAGTLLEHVIHFISHHIPTNEETRKKIYYGGNAALVAISALSFYAFRGLSYGMSGPMVSNPGATAAVYKWMDSWEV